MTPNTLKALAAAVLMSTTPLLAACGGDSGTTSAAEPPPAQDQDQAQDQAGTARLSANNASEVELQTIPGVGENIAHEIVEYRPYDTKTGPAKFRDEMRKYIDDDQIEAIIQYLDFDN